MMLCWSGVPFESVCYDVSMDSTTGALDARSWFTPKKDLKLRNPFVNLPYVRAGERGVVSQTNACMSYLGRKLGMWGETEEEVVMCETLLSEIMDLRNQMTKYAYSQDFDKTEQDGKDLLRGVKGKNGILQKFELHLGGVQGSGPFLIGAKCTSPDFHFYEMIDQYCTLSTFLSDGDLLEGFPNIRKHYEAFKSNPRNKYYLDSDLNTLPFNNKRARFGSTPGGGRFQKGQEYGWKDVGGVYQGPGEDAK